MPRELLQAEFPDEVLLVRNHVLVHATLKGLWLNVLQEPARLERDLKFTEAFPAYKRAWEIVEEKGYKNLLNMIKQ